MLFRSLVANSTLFGVLGTLGEALALADGLGLARDAAFEVLAATPLASQAERRRPAIESDDYPPRYTLALALKDAGLIIKAAEKADVDVRPEGHPEPAVSIMPRITFVASEGDVAQ